MGENEREENRRAVSSEEEDGEEKVSGWVGSNAPDAHHRTWCTPGPEHQPEECDCVQWARGQLLWLLRGFLPDHWTRVSGISSIYVSCT